MFIGVASCLVSTICPPFIGGDIDVFLRSCSALSLCDACVIQPAVSWTEELIVVSAPGITPLSRDLSSGSSRPADPIAVLRVRPRPSLSCRSSVVSPTDPKPSVILPTAAPVSPRPEQIRPALALFPDSGPRRSGPEDTCGARVRRTLEDTRADWPISQIAPFSENPVFPKSPQTANWTHEPWLSDPRIFPTPAIPSNLGSRNDTQIKRRRNLAQLSHNETPNPEPTTSSTNVAYRPAPFTQQPRLRGQSITTVHRTALSRHVTRIPRTSRRHANDLSLNRRSNAIYRAARILSLHTDTPQAGYIRLCVGQALPHPRIRQPQTHTPPPHTPPSHFFPNPPHASLPRQSRQLATAPPEHSGHTSRHPADQTYQPHIPYLHPTPSLTGTLHTAPLHPIQQHP